MNVHRRRFVLLSRLDGCVEEGKVSYATVELWVCFWSFRYELAVDEKLK